MGAAMGERTRWEAGWGSSALGVVLAVVGAAVVAVLFAGRSEEVYGVIVDAGSTGTRVNVCGFRVGDGGMMVLRRFLYEEIDKGLLSAGEVRELLQPLLEIAKKEVPGKVIAETRIYLGATAGLRIVGEERAERILSEAREVLSTSGFEFRDEFVSIMDGEDEGLFAWATVNELMAGKGSVGTVDLGGGSVQLTYAVEDEQHSTRKLLLGGKEFPVSSHSHLGYGIKEFRKTLYRKLSEDEVLLENPCVEKGAEMSMPVGVEGDLQWTRGTGNFDECVQRIVSTFDFRDPDSGEPCEPHSETCVLQGIRRPEPKGEFVAFAYFYDTVVRDAGLPATAQLDHLRQRGFEACQNKSDSCSCGDIAFVYGLLKYGLRLEGPHVKLLFKQRIGNNMIGWAVGALLHRLSI